MSGRFNEILVGRYNRFLQKFLAMKGGPPAPQLSSDLQAVWAMFHGQENRYLEGWDLFGATTNEAASPANLSGIRFRNPGTSNVVAVLSKFVIHVTAAQQPLVTMGANALDLGTIQNTNGNRIDNRARPGTTLIVSGQNNAATIPTLPFTLDSPFLAGNAPYGLIVFEDQEITILPGDAVQVVAGAVNLAITTSILWRERAIEESERT